MVQNLVWATGYNLVAIPVAMGLFVPWGIDLPMAAGAVAMSLSTIIVAANAQLLRRLRLGPQRVGGRPRPRDRRRLTRPRQQVGHAPRGERLHPGEIRERPHVRHLEVGAWRPRVASRPTPGGRGGG